MMRPKARRRVKGPRMGGVASEAPPLLLGRQGRRLARQQDEDGLRDVLGEVPVAQLPYRREVDEVHVPRDDALERRRRPGFRVFRQPSHVVHHANVPSPSSCRPMEKVTPSPRQRTIDRPVIFP